jgi:hypothetical protein
MATFGYRSPNTRSFATIFQATFARKCNSHSTFCPISGEFLLDEAAEAAAFYIDVTGFSALKSSPCYVPRVCNASSTSNFDTEGGRERHTHTHTQRERERGRGCVCVCVWVCCLAVRRVFVWLCMRTVCAHVCVYVCKYICVYVPIYPSVCL